MTIQEELLNKNFPNNWRIVIKSKTNKELKFKRNFKRLCSICGREFIAGGNSSWCGCCSLEFKCNHCKKWIPFSVQKLYKLNLNSEYGCIEYCHYLGAKLKMSAGKCCSCGKDVSKRDQFCFGYECGCHNKIYTEHNQSKIMKEISKENGLKYGINNLINYNKSEKGRLKSKEIIEEVNKLGLNSFIGSKEQQEHLKKLNTNIIKFCKKCNKETPHNGYNKCLICFPKIVCTNFITKDNVRYYKVIEAETFAKKILSSELDINQYPGINIRFSRVCYGTEDILTSEKLIKNNNFETKHDVLYFYDRCVNDYIPWEDYKKKFIIYSNEYIDIDKILSLLPGFKIYPTFRSQNSDSWTNGSKSAFEQSLVDDDILWFVYIKFYLDAQNNSKPLVCGKSGSLLVNSNGSDLSFSTDINDGPARRFLAENSGKYLWDKTKVAILPCKSEQEAYKLENKYTELLNLFGS